MAEGLVLLLAFVYTTTVAIDWRIGIVSSGRTSPFTKSDMIVTFFDRGRTSDAIAPKVTMAMQTDPNGGSVAVANISIPEITRPVKIDVWSNETEFDFVWKLLELTMENPSDHFTFECNCSIGNEHHKTTIFPTEDTWEVDIETGGRKYGRAKVNCTLELWDNTGVSHTATFRNDFALNETVTISLFIPLYELVTYSLSSLEADYWDCKQLTFIHTATCRSFIFPCQGFKNEEISADIENTGIVPGCSVSTSSPTTSTTVVTSNTISTNTETPLSTVPIPSTTDRISTATSQTSHTTISDQHLFLCCPCVPLKSIVNMTSAELDFLIRQLKADLLLNKTSLSVTIRKKNCASDSRASSKAIGTMGAAIIAFPIVSILLCDLQKLHGYLQYRKTL